MVRWSSALLGVAVVAGVAVPSAAPVSRSGSAVPIAIRVLSGGATTPAIASNTCTGTATPCQAVLDTKAGNCAGPGRSSCQVTLAVQWSVARADLAGQVLCVYWHTSFGTLRRSGEQLIVPPGGDPSGDWTSTCDGLYPLDNSNPGAGGTRSGITQILSADVAGSGAVQAYLLRAGDLQKATDFRTALIGQTPLATVTFAAGKTPGTKPAEGPVPRSVTRERYAFSVAVKAEATRGASGLFPSYVQSRIVGSGTAWRDLARGGDVRDGGALGTFLVVHEFLSDVFPDYKTTLEVIDVLLSPSRFEKRRLLLRAKVVSSTFSGCRQGSSAVITFVQAARGERDLVGLAVCGDELGYEAGRPDAADKVTVRVRKR